MLTTSRLFSQQSYEAAAREAEGGFRHRTCAFLRRSFGSSVADLDEDALSDFAGQALQDGQMAGATSSALLLQYLVPVTYWGRGFVSDLQYRSVLRSVNWPLAIPASYQHLETALTALAREIDRFEHSVSADCASAGRVLNALQDVADHDWRAEEVTLLPRAVAHVWPARARRLGEALVQSRCQAMLDNMQIRDLSKSEAAVLLCLSFALGHRLHDDLHFPWIGAAFQEADTDRCPLLLEGLHDYYLASIQAVSSTRNGRQA